MATREQLLAQAHELLGQTGIPVPTVVVSVEAADVLLRFEGPPPVPPLAPEPLDPRPDMQCPSHWFLLSPLEERLVRAADGVYRPMRELCDRAGLELERDTGAVLRNLCARNILEVLPSKGYRLRAEPSCPDDPHAMS